MINLRKGASIVSLAFVLMPSVTSAQIKSPGAKAAVKIAKLEEAKLKVCQNKEAAITKRSTQLTKMATNMLEKFDAIATRVKTYYTTKAIPAGKTVSNYDAIVTEIATKKAAVLTELAAAQTTAAAFNCMSDDPKGQLTQYRTDMQAVKTALQAYRTAIKNLIVAVRSVAGSSTSASPKASTSPATSPSATAEVE